MFIKSTLSFYIIFPYVENKKFYRCIRGSPFHNHGIVCCVDTCFATRWDSVVAQEEHLWEIVCRMGSMVNVFTTTNPSTRAISSSDSSNWKIITNPNPNVQPQDRLSTYISCVKVQRTQTCHNRIMLDLQLIITSFCTFVISVSCHSSFYQ